MLILSRLTRARTTAWPGESNLVLRRRKAHWPGFRQEVIGIAPGFNSPDSQVFTIDSMLPTQGWTWEEGASLCLHQLTARPLQRARTSIRTALTGLEKYPEHSQIRPSVQPGSRIFWMRLTSSDSSLVLRHRAGWQDLRTLVRVKSEWRWEVEGCRLSKRGVAAIFCYFDAVSRFFTFA